MTHTLGPWQIGGELISQKGANMEIASVWSHSANRRFSPSQSEADANARLIAAAPDLLAACELALPVLRDQHAALAPILHGGICPDREAMFAVEAAIAKATEY